jgi:fucose 4-O-acetylase-like acetyltransferase
MSWTGTLKNLGVGILIVVLGHWLNDIDGVVH